MQFVDGENLTIRSQELFKQSNVVLANSANYRRDTLLWPPPNILSLGTPRFAELWPIRSFYYTSLVGDDDLLQDTRERLRGMGFDPHVFKKSKQSQKAKGVDIALTKDMLSHAFRGNYETAVLVAGDGDYLPVVDEVKRLGKQAVVRFIPAYTSDELRLAADNFVDIVAKLQEWAFHPNVEKVTK